MFYTLSKSLPFSYTICKWPGIVVDTFLQGGLSWKYAILSLVIPHSSGSPRQVGGGPGFCDLTLMSSLPSSSLSAHSRTEAVPPARDECDGVHPRHPVPPHQGWPGLRPESADQRAGTLDAPRLVLLVQAHVWFVVPVFSLRVCWDI